MMAGILRRLCAVLLLSFALPTAAALAADAAQAPTVVRVVIVERLMQPPPEGLAVLSDAIEQVDREFAPRSTELGQLSRQMFAAQEAADKAGPTDQAAIDLADRLTREFTAKQEDASRAYSRRRDEVFAPLMQEVDLALQRYMAMVGEGDMFLVTAADFSAPSDPPLEDVTEQFVAWMKTQP